MPRKVTTASGPDAVLAELILTRQRLQGGRSWCAGRQTHAARYLPPGDRDEAYWWGQVQALDFALCEIGETFGAVRRAPGTHRPARRAA